MAIIYDTESIFIVIIVSLVNGWPTALTEHNLGSSRALCFYHTPYSLTPVLQKLQKAWCSFRENESSLTLRTS